jgi:hypothetical protein
MYFLSFRNPSMQLLFLIYSCIRIYQPLEIRRF